MLGVERGTCIKQRTKACVSFLPVSGENMDYQKAKNNNQNKVLRQSKYKVMRLRGGDLEIVKRDLKFFPNDLSCLDLFCYKLSIPDTSSLLH
jgi:hypothetical protein